ncbi:hypothetical protein BOTBODRAFT_169025 [Botryobasidium botryosum FD-172 SS1]|uniref:Uncharacterized protein n=1 Tax=Botryobasidium botryosum (strain FD-172 SS1) TaxID=930990 RepID=A0A067N1I7_BOTB1|nr:hypothetical protein BOTBODRAFT_169025 [Botryobasidium botryosum FD-172 SS1]
MHRVRTLREHSVTQVFAHHEAVPSPARTFSVYTCSPPSSHAPLSRPTAVARLSNVASAPVAYPSTHPTTAAPSHAACVLPARSHPYSGSCARPPVPKTPSALAQVPTSHSGLVGGNNHTPKALLSSLGCPPGEGEHTRRDAALVLRCRSLSFGLPPSTPSWHLPSAFPLLSPALAQTFFLSLPLLGLHTAARALDFPAFSGPLDPRSKAQRHFALFERRSNPPYLLLVFFCSSGL